MVETRCCGDTTTSPEWRKDLALPVAVAQWSRSHLKMEVWNREAFLTDDFLGQVVVPLKNVLPQVCMLSLWCFVLTTFFFVYLKWYLRFLLSDFFLEWVLVVKEKRVKLCSDHFSP